MPSTKETLKAQQDANFLGDHESVFSYDFNVPGIVHFLFFEVPWCLLRCPSAFLGESIAISKPHSTYEFERSLLQVILCQMRGKRSPWKNYFGP